ncbi:hypothetical protein CN367_11620 [Priestia megaterium]|uniref:hypothetical protein n=1 Tax=Priestia megaterium TaxID=1404 RepID=UPI000BF8F465|nr:hypothetical protein [Priestia megaterium]PEZ47012.1 hypothetical protein CN367_11620 [Priestia megaterium]
MKFTTNLPTLPVEVEKPRRFVTVFLFSETNPDTGDSVGLQYELDAYQVNDLLAGIDEKKNLLRFGDTFHHSDDIIRITLN